MQLAIRVALVLGVFATIELIALEHPARRANASAPISTSEDLIRIGDCVINLSNVTYIRFIGADETGTSKDAMGSVNVYFNGGDKPLQISGKDAEQLRSIILGMGLPNSDKLGLFDPAEASRRGFGNPNSHTFGGLGVPAQGGGIFLTGSVPGTPAAAIGLEYGDLIVSINGKPVNTQAEYVKAVHESPDTMSFVVRNVRTGQPQQMSIQLRRPLKTIAPEAKPREPTRPADPTVLPLPASTEKTPPTSPPVDPAKAPPK